MLEIRDDDKPLKPKAEIINGLGNGELIQNIETPDDSEEETDWSHRSVDNNEKLTEDNLVTAAVNYANGHLPIVNRMLSLTNPNLKALDNIPYFQRSIQHPLLAVKILYYKLIRFFAQPHLSILTRTDFQLLLLLIYSLSSVENIFLFLPMLFYYLSLIVMTLTTFQVLQTNRDFQDFRVWSQLFLTYSGGSLNPEEAQYQFIKNNLKPFGQFFIALLVNLIIYPLIAQEWLPQTEITILSFFFMFATLLTFMVKERRFPDWLLLFSFAVNVLAKYPYETDPVVTQGWRFLDIKIPTLFSYVIGNGIDFCLNSRVVLYAILPVISYFIARKQNWRGTYKYLIPHCMTLSWLQLVVINSQGATMFGLLRSTLALVGIVLFLPLLGVTSILLPALAFAKWFTNNFMFSIAVFLTTSTIGLGISFLLSRTRFSRFITILQLIFGLFAGYLLINSYVDINKSIEINNKNTINDNNNKVTWELYHNYCHQPSWDNVNVATTQLNCQKFDDVPVSWTGYVNDVKLKTVTNNYKYVIDKLPGAFRGFLYCFFGERYDENCDNYVTEALRKDCQVINSILKKCSLAKHDKYGFEILIRMQSGIWAKGAEIVLVTDNSLGNFTLQLKPNDKIFFKGRLVNDNGIGSDGLLGGLKPHVKLNEIGCLACHNTELTFVRAEMEQNTLKSCVEIVIKGLKFTFNILFNPYYVK